MTEIDDRDILWYFRSSLALIIGSTVMAASVSIGLNAVRNEALVQVFLAALLTWTGYLFTHYAVTGRFIHQRSKDSSLPHDPRTITGIVIGTLILAAGATIGITATGHQNYLIAIPGFAAAFLGYVFIHYLITGELL